MHTINLKRSAATLAAAAGLLAAATGPAEANELRWSFNAGADAPVATLSLKADSNEVAVEGVKPRHSVGRENTIEI